MIWVLLLLVAGAVGVYFYINHTTPRRLTVGAKATVEGSVLSEILLQHLQHRLGAGQVVLHSPLATTKAAHEALVIDEVSLYPEYSGTALVSILGLAVATEVEPVREQVRENYRSRFQFEWIGPLGFDAATSLAIRKGDAEKYAVTSISELAASPGCCIFAFSKDFEQNLNGVALLMRSYKLGLRGAVQPLEANQLYAALANGQAGVVSAHSTDGQLASSAYVFLKDDKQIFPPNEAGILVRSATLEEWPKLGDALRQLNGRIDSAAMLRMNAAVVLNNRRPADVAAEFLSTIER